MKSRGPEQLAISKLIDVTVDDFEKSLDGCKFFFLAGHSLVEPKKLALKVAKDRGLNLFDERRNLESLEIRKREYLENLIEASQSYLGWIGERGFQPLLRDLLVMQCVGFENLLKTLAVACELTKLSAGNLDKLIFVPSTEFRAAHNEINNRWDLLAKRKTDQLSRVFIQQEIGTSKEVCSKYSGMGRLDFERWGSTWQDAFRLRNAVVHSRSRPKNQIELGEEVFCPLDEAQITEQTVLAIDEAFRTVVSAFRISLNDL